MTAAIHLWIRGRVQGVFFRASTAQAGNELGLDGWARNLYDGRVEVWAQGDEDRLDELIRWCQDGPPMARVDEVDRETVAADPALVGKGFTVNHGR